MPRYPIVTAAGRQYYPMPYDDLRIGEGGERPTAMVPCFGSVEEALAAAQEYLEARLAPLRCRFAGGSTAVDATYEDKLANPTVFFRGQDDVKYSMVPTRYRLATLAGAGPEVGRRVQAERERAAAIGAYFAQERQAPLSDLQARAVARHFGAPSTLIDFTFDPAVAAAFAHPPFSARERAEGATLGIIYALDMGQLQELFGMMAWGIHGAVARDIHLVNTRRTWALPFLGWDAAAQAVTAQQLAVPVPEALGREHAALRTCTVSGVSRIEAQRGLFLELALSDAGDVPTHHFFWTVLDFVAAKWCFLRQDRSFVVRDAGGGERDLFREDDPELVRVAGGGLH